MIESSKDYYSNAKVADNYDSERFVSIGGKMFDEQEKNVVISSLPRDVIGIKALDAGAGSGRFTIELAKRNINVVSSDYSPAMLEIIRAKVKDNHLEKYVTISRQDVTRLNFPDNEFDFVSCIRVTVNLDTKENSDKAIKELMRVCKPGGTVILDIVNPWSLAILGPQKSSMVTMRDTIKLLETMPDVKIIRVFGRRILSQSAFEKSPVSLLKVIDKLDSGLSRLFPFFCVRIYFMLSKN
jgi:ubiquinone/menaquinone biosynthesis C-methylase UbiE